MSTTTERVAALSQRLDQLNTRLRKAWTDEARAAAVEARRVRARLPGYLAARGYLQTGYRYDNPHAGDWSRSQLFFEHERQPHKKIVFHSSGDWELHNLRRQRGARHPEAAVARGRGLPGLRAALRRH